MVLRLMRCLIPSAECSCRGHLAHQGVPEQGGERCQGAGGPPLPPPSPAPPGAGPARRPSHDGSLSNSSSNSRRGTREEGRHDACQCCSACITLCISHQQQAPTAGTAKGGRPSSPFSEHSVLQPAFSSLSSFNADTSNLWGWQSPPMNTVCPCGKSGLRVRAQVGVAGPPGGRRLSTQCRRRLCFCSGSLWDTSR